MATLSDLRTAVRRDVRDLNKPGEQNIDVDPTATTYPIPTIGPILSSSLSVDVDGTTKTSGVDFTFYESGYIVFNSIPSGINIHATFQWNRWSDKDLNQFIQEAVREFSVDFPKQNTRYRTPFTGSGKLTTTLSSPYTKGDGVLVVASTAGFDTQGIVKIGSYRFLYSGTDATHFNNLSIWVGPDTSQASGAVVTMDDNENHGWVYDPTVVRFVYTVEGYEPVDEFGVGMGYQDIAYHEYDSFSGYLKLEFDFAQNITGVTSQEAPQDQFKVRTGEYYAVPALDTDVLQTPDYAFNPISWLAAALALEARETDRDLSYREQSGIDTTADPTETFVRSGAAFRKKYEEWAKRNFRTSWFPRARRRISRL